MRTHRLLLVLIGLALSIVAMTTFASDWYVDPVNGNNANGGASWPDAWKTLKYAALQTNGTGTEAAPCVIHLAAGAYSPSTNGETFPISLGTSSGGGDTWSLIGAGAGVTIIDAEGSARVLTGQGYRGTITDLTITGGDGDPEMSESGGLRHDITNNGYFTMERCVVSGNNAGSGVDVRGSGKIKTRRCLITDNCSGGSGAGMYIRPGDGVRVDVQDCEFSYNRAIEPSGNAGGGLRTSGARTGSSINRCRFIGNSSLQHGGGVFLAGTAPVLENCYFADNTAEEGGGIGLSGSYGEYVIKNCLITNNTATGGKGAGIMCDWLWFTTHGESDIYNCTIVDNDGSGVYLYVGEPGGELSEARLYNCIVWGQDK